MTKKSAKKSTARTSDRKSLKTAKAVKKASRSTARNRLRDEQVIRLKVTENPRRPGTDVFRHFEAMKGSVTVGTYLSKFKVGDRWTARQWLHNTIADGLATVLG